MSALSFARQAFGLDKPHSSVTDWIDILTSNKITEEAYEGIPELVDAITLQASGPAEAARALRKKLKHGQPHQQYRALVILKALVENAGPRFHAAFSDDQIVDAFRQLSSDPHADKKVKKKLLLILASWRDQYQTDPSMSLFAGLYRQCKGDYRMQSPPPELAHMVIQDTGKEEKKKAKQKREREELKKKDEEAKRTKTAKAGRVPFNLEKERPNVLSTIAEASQASSNLTNAIMLVNTQTESIEDNQRVQECLDKAKQARKSLVRYIQLVEDEDLIGALIETNDRIVAAIDLYEDAIRAAESPDATKEITRGLAATQIDYSKNNGHESPDETGPSQVESVHPDLRDLSFGPLGPSSSKLPAPINPSKLSDNYYDSRRNSLSDFSDYESSGEEARNAKRYPPPRKYAHISDNVSTNKTRSLPDSQEEDPFADPFSDERAILPISQ